MDQISAQVRLLYYLNLAPKDRVLEYICNDAKTFDYHIAIASSTSGTRTAKQITRQILKELRTAAK